MDEKGTKDDILILNNALIFNTELGGESAKEIEADVLLLTNAVMQEPVVKKIDVGPRISGPELLEARAARDQTLVSWKPPGWNIIQPPKQGRGLVLEQPSTPILSPMPSEKMPSLNNLDEAVQPISGDAQPTDLAQLLAEARALANDYGVMNLRTRSALYAALGRTYDITFHVDSQPEAFARLIEAAGLTSQNRAPYTPIVKLVFGAGYDKTRIAEFAAAIVYGRRKGVSAGSFSGFLEAFDGGLKAVIGLERLTRKGNGHGGGDSERNEARPEIARKLRTISLQPWGNLSSEGDEFALLMARRLPDGSIAMVGEVPRDIALLEKAARKLLANLGRTDEDQIA